MVGCHVSLQPSRTANVPVWCIMSIINITFVNSKTSFFMLLVISAHDF
jgi:hypothetical protein